jgi:hypothetical protein
MVRWNSRQKSNHLHSGPHSRLNAWTCVFENQALPRRYAQALGGVQIAFRVWLTVADLIDRHNHLRKGQPSG